MNASGSLEESEGTGDAGFTGQPCTVGTARAMQEVRCLEPSFTTSTPVLNK